MTPLSQNPGLDASQASQPDGLKADLSDSSSLKPMNRSAGSARIEQIVNAKPVAVHALPQPPVKTLASIDWSTLRKDSALAADIDALLKSIAVKVQASEVRIDLQFLDATKLSATVDVAENHSDSFATEVLNNIVHRSAAQAIQDRISVTLDLPDEGVTVVCCPCKGGSGCVVVTSESTCDSGLSEFIAEFSGVLVSEWQLSRHAASQTADCEHLAALIDLQARVSAKETLPAALCCLADELRKYLNATTVYVGLCEAESDECRLAAVSDRSEVNSLTEESKAAEAVLQEAVIRQQIGAWPITESNNGHALRCHEQFAKLLAATQLVSLPVRDDAGINIGAVVIATEAATLEDHRNHAVIETTRFLRAAERPLGTSIQIVKRSSQGTISRAVAALRRGLTSGIARTAGVLLALFSSLMCVPVDYEVACQSELQPVSRRFIAAPFEAPLKKCLVDPGDVVEAGQVLAELDGRELRWELAGIKADLGKASREHDAFLSEQEFGRAAIARLEMDRLQNRASLLSDRTRGLEIRSPVAGIVVAGDLKDSEGVPLDTGESLFEVAPLDEMLVEILVPEDDIRHVAEGMKIRLQLDARPSENFYATIERIYPKAELRDHENVFVAEAKLADHELWLRPGMRGEAEISTGPRALGWNLFHKPVASICGWLGW